MAGTITIETSRAERVAALLIARRQTVAVSESSTGGLVSAALLSVPGASAYFLGGGIIYTGTAREALLGVGPSMIVGMRSATEAMARLLARTVRERLAADWGLAETGATGPKGNRYGDAAGHSCIAICGPQTRCMTLETGRSEREDNMWRFAREALALFEQVLRG